MERVRYFRGGRERVLETLVRVLEGEEDVLLAIVFGSFVELDSYRDVDVAVYLRGCCSLDRILSLGVRLERALGLPVDLVPLNMVDARFRWHILAEGLVVFERVPGLYEALLSMTLDEMAVMRYAG